MSLYFSTLFPPVFVLTFEGQYIHHGNYPEDTKGCILVGTTKGKDKVSGSINKLNEIIEYIDEIIKNDKENKEKTNIQVIVQDPIKK